MEDDDDMDEDTDDFTVNVGAIAQELVKPGGDLVFPCDSCNPGNATGFECDTPIPMPTKEQVDAETERIRRPIRLPQPGEPRASLSLAGNL